MSCLFRLPLVQEQIEVNYFQPNVLIICQGAQTGHQVYKNKSDLYRCTNRDIKIHFLVEFLVMFLFLCNSLYIYGQSLHTLIGDINVMTI